mmetsp:Transcript_4520/g.7005  ORF Transcript_4520/g.7005 Transcript_4520/m.7005 type:complete len:86 (-) Transcript_4520:35-292(-)
MSRHVSHHLIIPTKQLYHMSKFQYKALKKGKDWNDLLHARPFLAIIDLVGTYAAPTIDVRVNNDKIEHVLRPFASRAMVSIVQLR